MTKTVVLKKRLSLVSLDYSSLTKADFDALQAELSYTKICRLEGPAYQNAISNGRAGFVSEYRHCFSKDRSSGHVVFMKGFLPRVTTFLKKRGYEAKVIAYKERFSDRRPDVLKPDWDNLFRQPIEFRRKQDKILQLIASRDFGRFDCPTGYGKSFLIGCASLLFPKAKIHVVCTEKAALLDIHNAVSMRIGDVGLVHATKKANNQRVICYTGQSLHHSKFNADILFADEVHTLASDQKLRILSEYRNAKMFGFSASHEREDNAHFELEGLFGPIILQIQYEEAVKAGAVIPMEVHWWNTDYGKSYAGVPSSIRDRVAIATNDARNSVIAEAARYYYGLGNQVLIFCRTLEHVVRLKERLPKFEIAYSPNSAETDRFRSYIGRGYLPANYEILNAKSLDELKRRFASGEVQGVICTPVWKAGVDFKNLNVIVRADAISSGVSNTQIPGRAARVGEKAEASVVVDFTDGFDSNFHGKRQKRKRLYAEKQWRQFVVKDGHDPQLRKFIEV